jgi:hypothetical protein
LRNAGGIIGNAANGGTIRTGGGIKVNHCICWSPSIKASGKGNGFYSCGAIVGYTAVDNYLYHSWYYKDMVLEGPNDQNVLKEQNRYGGFNVNNWASLEPNAGDAEKKAAKLDPIVPGTTLGTNVSATTDESGNATYYHIVPYHGGTVNSETTSARLITNHTGFDKNIWDLSNIYDANYIMPKLKNNKEQ